MRQFVYFIPDVVFGDENQQEQILESAGLSDRFPGGRGGRMAGKGPNGENGFFFARDSTCCSYKPDEQTWSGPFGKGGYWIGFRTDAPPGPEDLARAKQYKGHMVELADGNEWLIPAASMAPCVMVMKDGAVEMKPQAMREKLWAIVEENRDLLWGTEKDGKYKEGEGIDAPVVMGIAATCLGANYLISLSPEEELSALGLITTGNNEEMIQALFDMPNVLVRAQKKTEASEA